MIESIIKLIAEKLYSPVFLVFYTIGVLGFNDSSGLKALIWLCFWCAVGALVQKVIGFKNEKT